MKTRKDVLDQMLKLIHVQCEWVQKGIEHERETGAILDPSLSIEIRRLDRMYVSYDRMLEAGKNQPARKRPCRRGGGIVTRMLAEVFDEPDLKEGDNEDEPKE